ncbi:MAG: NADP-dependent oxidoreductase [Catenulispora sp.]|nr:NADP-dependent oxidoreductase [Catenulispora sp.]
MGVRAGLEVRLAARPKGEPTASDFRLVQAPVPEPAPGRLLVRNLYMSVDPYMRNRMNEGDYYLPPFELDAPMTGGAVGEVLESRYPGLAPGDAVVHDLGWRQYAVVDGEQAQPIDPWAEAPLSAYLGALGLPGLAAYVGIKDIAEVRPGDVVYVSAAAGAVGALAGQIARLCGASRVIGSAGSAAKVEHLRTRLGFDAAFNYRDRPVRMQLRALAPDGIDVYFDNVGGDHLEAAMLALRPFGRVALCGTIAQYASGVPQEGPRTMPLAVSRRLTLRGFLVGDHEHRAEQFRADMLGWLLSGRVRADETISEGIENAVAALLGLFRGANTGKAVVRLAQ